jgi:molybdopterin converting factor small subunit
MTRLLLLGPAREAAGVRHDEIEGATVGEVLEHAVARYGADFARVLAVSQVWVNGDVAAFADAVTPHDEIEVLPPVSGG